MALSQALRHPTLACFATAVNEDRPSYYAALDAAGSRGVDVNPFLDYFAETALRSQEIALREVKFVLGKARFFSRFDSALNPRQRKVALRMLAEGSRGFEGGLSPMNYRAIAKTSSATATRDLAALVRMGAMTASGRGRSVRYALCMEAERPHLFDEVLGGGRFVDR